MTNEKIIESGFKELISIHLKSEKVIDLKNRLLDYEFNPIYPDDKYVWLSNTLALKGVDSGNFGIGSILVDFCGNVVIQGHNEVLNPYFRSDRHAEMVVIDEFEISHSDILEQDYTLYTSIEPCPMCSVRLITSSIKKVMYAAIDTKGGMIREMKNLPQLWIELSEGKVFSKAICSDELVNIANDIFQLNVDELIEKIKKLHSNK